MMSETVLVGEAGRQRLPLINALRALAAVLIVWHHFALYPPLRVWAAPVLGGLLDWFEVHARSTQVFFVIGGFVLAHTLADRAWGVRRVWVFLAGRYLRLGLPYLAVVGLMVPVSLLVRGWVPDDVLGGPVSVPQVLAHVFFLQDILGYESLSAGLWFVCINIQLSLLFAALLWLRDGLFAGRVDVLGLAGWGLSVFSLFYANRLPGWEVWAVYFFPYFFLGVVVWRASRPGGRVLEFWLLVAVFVLALILEWRWRLVVGVVSAGVLLLALRTGFAARWPGPGALLFLGRISYSLFLVHFPVLLLVSALWTWLGWVSPVLAGVGLLVSFAVSVALGQVFYHWVEAPAGRLSRLVRMPVGGSGGTGPG